MSGQKGHPKCAQREKAGVTVLPQTRQFSCYFSTWDSKEGLQCAGHWGKRVSCWELMASDSHRADTASNSVTQAGWAGGPRLQPSVA